MILDEPSPTRGSRAVQTGSLGRRQEGQHNLRPETLAFGLFYGSRWDGAAKIIRPCSVPIP
jgi:hypothetical protein